MSQSSNWETISRSQYAWEQDALDYVRQGFPSGPPFYAWSNFEFIAQDGSINEVDAFVGVFPIVDIARS